MDLPEPLVLQVPLVDTGNRNQIVQGQVAVLLPHDWHYHLGKHHKSQEIFGLDRLEEWWSGSSVKSPFFFQHPCLDRDYKTKGVPFVLHGDGAKLHDRDSLLTISLKPLLGHRGMKDSHLFLAALPKSVATDVAWEAIWQVLVWSLDTLAEGRHPMTDHLGQPFPPGSRRCINAGQPLMGEYFGVNWGMTGDLDYFMKDLGMPCHATDMFCWRCKSNRTTTPMKAFDP